MKEVSLLTSCSNFSDVMNSRYDKRTSCKYIHDNSLELSNRNIYRNKSVSITILEHRRTDIEVSFVTSWRDVVAWWHHANTKTITFWNLSGQKPIETKKIITVLSILQAKINTAWFLTSWDDVMTWRHHANKKPTTFLELCNLKYHRNKKESSF